MDGANSGVTSPPHTRWSVEKHVDYFVLSVIAVEHCKIRSYVDGGNVEVIGASEMYHDVIESYPSE